MSRRARCTSTVATGPRPLSRCASITVPRARPVGTPLSSSRSATSRIVSSSVSRFVFALAETSTNSVSPPHSDGTSAALDQLLAHARRVGGLLVDLVHGDDDRHLGGLRVVERLDGLRHHAVVGRDDQHGDVGDLGAAGAHRGERLVARRVDERDVALAHVRLVGADVLRDAAELAGDHVGLADRVEQLRLAVVDVAHDRDDRRPRHEQRLVDLVVAVLLDELVLEPDDLGLHAELGGHQRDRLVGQRRGRRRHLARQEQDLHDVGRSGAELLGDRLRGGARTTRSVGVVGLGGRTGHAWRATRPPAAACGAGAELPGAEAASGAGWSGRTRRRWRRPEPARRGGGSAGAAASASAADAVEGDLGGWGGGLLPRGLRLARRGGGSSTSRRFGASVALPAGCPEPRHQVLGHAGGGGLPRHAHLLQRRQQLLAGDPEFLRQFVDPHAAPIRSISFISLPTSSRAEPRSQRPAQHPGTARRLDARGIAVHVRPPARGPRLRVDRHRLLGPRPRGAGRPWARRARHPTQVRIGPGASAFTPRPEPPEEPRERRRPPRRRARHGLRRLGRLGDRRRDRTGSVNRPGTGRLGAAGAAAAARASSATCVSDLMSMRHPVSRAASRAFCPSLPIASESW